MSASNRSLRPLWLALLFGASTCLAATKTDPNATASTQALYKNLQALQQREATAFGQQFGTWQGIDTNGNPWPGTSWPDFPDRSDIKTLTGYHPAVTGWNIQTYLELPADKKPLFVQRIKDDYEQRKGIITFHWTMKNLLTRGSDRDRTGWQGYPKKGDTTILASALIPGYCADTGYCPNAELIGYLDEFANLLSQLTADGRPIPILFRPFHEMHGDAQWWTSGNPGEYINFWRYVQTYLRNTKGIHQLLYVYAPGGDKMDVNTTTEYLRYWPGDDAVDVCGMDLYGGDFNAYMQTASTVATQKNMVAAFTEIGPGTGKGLYGVSNGTTWWTSNVLAAFNNPANPLWTKAAYMMTWTNQATNNYFVPYRTNHPQAGDFIAFAADTKVLLLPELPPMYEATETFTGTAAEDGWIRETGENSGIGGYTQSTELRAGDDTGKKQIRAILSFDTSQLPDDAIITAATLRMKRSGSGGTISFSSHGSLRVDIIGGYGFSGSVALANSDFRDDPPGNPDVVSDVVSSGLSNAYTDFTDVWTAGELTSGLSTINRTGTTQFRVYFSKDDNNDGVGDFITWYSGEAAIGRPELIITYR